MLCARLTNVHIYYFYTHSLFIYFYLSRFCWRTPPFIRSFFFVHDSAEHLNRIHIINAYIYRHFYVWLFVFIYTTMFAFISFYVIIQIFRLFLPLLYTSESRTTCAHFVWNNIEETKYCCALWFSPLYNEVSTIWWCITRGIVLYYTYII